MKPKIFTNQLVEVIHQGKQWLFVCESFTLKQLASTLKQVVGEAIYQESTVQRSDVEDPLQFHQYEQFLPKLYCQPAIIPVANKVPRPVRAKASQPKLVKMEAAPVPEADRMKAIREIQDEYWNHLDKTGYPPKGKTWLF